MKQIILLIGAVLAGGMAIGADESGPGMEDQVAQLRAQSQKYRQAFFANEFGKPLVRGKIIKNWNHRGDFTRHYVQAILLFSTRVCELNEQKYLAEANAALREMCQYHLDRPQTFFEIHSFPGAVPVLARLYLDFGPQGIKAPNRLSEQTCAVLLKTLWEWANEESKVQDADWKQSQTWWIFASENHHALHFTGCWSASLVLKNVPEYQDKPFQDGHTPAEHYAAWTGYLKEYLRQRAGKGTFVEIDSPSYATATLRSIYDLYDLSEDPVLKNRAGQLLELYWALWAEEQLDAVTGGGQTRCYPEHAVRGGSFLGTAAAYVIGIGAQGRYQCGMIPFVDTTWEVPDVVLKIVASRATHKPYEIRERRMGLAEKGYDRPAEFRLKTDFGGILRYTYCTPDFIMGSLITEARPTSDWAAISSQNRWSGVIFSGEQDARVFPCPYNAKEKIIQNGFWSVQSKGTMISQRLPSAKGRAPIEGEGISNGWRVFFSTAGLSAPVQRGPWTFAEAKSAYVGVRVVAGDVSFEQSKYGRWLVCKDSMTPVIIEAGRKSDYPDFTAFQKAAQAWPVSFQNGVVNYESLGGDKLTFHADRSRLPEINGTVVNLSPVKVYDSPFIQSKWDSGVVTIQKGDHKVVLDFNKEKP